MKKACRLSERYVVETTFTSLDVNTTKMEFSHYYSTNSLKAKTANLVARPKIVKESQDTLDAIKNAIEQSTIPKKT